MDKMQNEYVVYRFWPVAVFRRPVWLLMVIFGVLITAKSPVIGLALIFMGMVTFVLSYLDAKDDHLAVSPESIRRIQRAAYIFGWNESVINPKHIQSVTLRQDMFQRFLGVGTLVIETAGAQPFEFPDALHACRAVEAIRSLSFRES